MDNRIFETSAKTLKGTSTLLRILLLFIFLHLMAAHASETVSPDLEESVTYDPRQVSRDAERDYRAARERGDKVSELRAIELYLLAEKVERGFFDSPPYSEDLERGMLLARELGDNQSLCSLTVLKSYPLISTLNPNSKKLLLILDEAISLAQRHHLNRCLADAYMIKGLFYAPGYPTAEGMAWLNNAYKIYEKQRDNFGQAKAISAIAVMYAGPDVSRENQLKNIEYLNRTLILLNPQQHRSMVVEIYHRLGIAYFRIQNFTEARRFLEASLKLAEELRSDHMVNLSHYRLGQLAMDENRLHEALIHFETALHALETDQKAKTYFTQALITYAQLLGRLERYKGSLEALTRARALLPEINFPKAEWLYYSTAATIYAQVGDYRQAYQQLSMLRQVDERLAKAANEKLVNELKVGFEVHLKESENTLLRAQQKQSDAQRLVLALAFALSLVLLIGAGMLAFLLRQRAAAAKVDAQRHLELAAAEQKANQAKSTFLANMSHELRSPLNAILGFSELALRAPHLPPSVKEDLTTVVKSGEHLYALINQVLDLSKLEAGRTTLNEINFDLYALLDELIDLLTLGATQKGVQLIVENEPEAPQYVRADEVKLRQVLINLVNNALKFTREGSITMRVGNAQSNGNPANCLLSFAVIDSGPGIAAEELSKLGEAFTQAQAGRQAREGTGLGLAISRSFIQLMGGELHISSELGHGTTVSFTVPMLIVAAEDTNALPSKAKRRVVALTPNQPVYRILVVDDRPESRKLLVRLLTPLGFEVREASNGQEALAIYQDWDPHLIWMDMRMPVMDGKEATRRIKASEKGGSTIVIALTASSFDDEWEDFRRLGCADLMRKPIKEEVLFELMSKHLGVTFEYERKSTEAAHIPVAAASLRSLPTDLVTELEAALVELDSEAIDRVIKTISHHDVNLANGLEALAKNFQYGPILTLLER